MKLSYNVQKWLVIIGIIIVFFGIIFVCQKISPENGVVIDKNFTYYNNKSSYRVLVKSKNFIVPIWIEVTKGYFDSLEINDIYYKNENSYMYSYWLQK